MSRDNNGILQEVIERKLDAVLKVLSSVKVKTDLLRIDTRVVALENA